MKSNMIRSNVFVIPNSLGGVYEITDDPNMYKVNLRQVTAWFEGARLCQYTRDVCHETDIALFQKGFIVPGNILRVYQTDPIGKEDECILYDEQGYMIKTDSGETIYTLLYYSPNSAFKSEGILPDDDKLEDLLHC